MPIRVVWERTPVGAILVLIIGRYAAYEYELIEFDY